MLIGTYYRPPNRDPDPLQQLDISLNKISSPSGLPNIVLTGDFNLPSVNWGDYSTQPNPQYGQEVNQELLEIAKEHSLEQCNKSPTRGKNILDLVFTTSPQLVETMDIDDGMSDHNIVITRINMKVKTNKNKPRTVLLFKKGTLTESEISDPIIVNSRTIMLPALQKISGPRSVTS